MNVFWRRKTAHTYSTKLPRNTYDWYFVNDFNGDTKPKRIIFISSRSNFVRTPKIDCKLGYIRVDHTLNLWTIKGAWTYSNFFTSAHFDSPKIQCMIHPSINLPKNIKKKWFRMRNRRQRFWFASYIICVENSIPSLWCLVRTACVFEIELKIRIGVTLW